MAMNVGNDSGDDEVMIDINTTPLIDVMLVLLIMFIITIPIQTHAVKMNMPIGPSSTPPVPPEIIRIDVDFDGTIGWNGELVTNRAALESRLQAVAAQANPARSPPATQQTRSVQDGGDDHGLGPAAGRDQDRPGGQRAVPELIARHLPGVGRSSDRSPFRFAIPDSKDRRP